MKILPIEYCRTDERGTLLQVTSFGNWKQLNHLIIKQGQFFGEHYHKHKEELFYLIKGNVSIEIKNVLNNEIYRTMLTLPDCPLLLVEPFEKHTLYANEDSELIELLSEPFDREDTITDE